MEKNGDFWKKIVIFSRGADQSVWNRPRWFYGYKYNHVSLLLTTCTIKFGINIIIFHTENYQRKWDKDMLHTEKCLRNCAKTHDIWKI